MKYFKNTELAKLYHVSEKAVRNWIDAAEQGKLELQLHKAEGRFYIAATSGNSQLIEKLVNRGKKYKNTKAQRFISPVPRFYELFSPEEIFGVVSGLDIHHETPLQYSYFDGGAAIWDAYIERISKETTSNILTNTIEILSLATKCIDDFLKDSNHVNIIDIGPGNGYPVRNFVQHFIDSGKLNRYIGIDASQDMLQIVQKNTHEWFGDKARFDFYKKDISYERFGDLLADDYLTENDSTTNIVLFLGATLSNFRDTTQPLVTIRESLGRDDLFVFSKQLDTVRARRHFDFGTSTESPLRLAPKSKFLLDLLGIDESLYSAEYIFDEEKMERRIQVRLKIALSIEFRLAGRQKVINFNKGDTIVTWRHKHQNTIQTINQFDANGFDLLQATTSKDRECLLTVSKIKSATN